jgi:hypothetical protein
MIGRHSNNEGLTMIKERYTNWAKAKAKRNYYKSKGYKVMLEAVLEDGEQVWYVRWYSQS